MKPPPAVSRQPHWASGLKGRWSPESAPAALRRPAQLMVQARERWPWALAAGLVSVLGAVLAVIWMANFKIPDLAPQAQSSRVLAADGRLIATLHAEQDRTVVPLDQISQHLQMAVLLSEDREFFEHRGMSYKGIVRAAFSNLAGGGIRQGGSTITQQYTRNAFPNIGLERRITRKLKEAFLAIQLEQHLSKRQIMERYLNTVYFGRGAYGVEAAARTYFKVSASEVTPGQAAYLAGVIRAPERYQINENPGEATVLRNRVIDDLVDAKALTAAEGRKAKREKLVEQFKPGASIEVESPKAGYFVEYVRRNLRTQFGLSDSQILRGGLTIHTTLDLNMQEAAEAAIRDVLNQPDDPEAALVAMGPQGEIKAMVGGRDVDSVSRARGFNFAIDQDNSGGGRQAGSAFKPFALAAFLTSGKSLQSTYSGASPMEITSGRCRNKDGTAWKVSNFEEASFGPMNITGATLSSVNTIYAQMMNTVVTPAKFIEIAGRTGIEIPKFDSGCALALGTTDVTPLEMARAYTTFSQRGNRPDPISILKIAEPNGRVIAEAAPRVEPKLDRNVADSINYVLEQNIRSGTGTSAKIGRPAAGKTGTTQNHANAWFAGYTPDLTAVVWMGYAPGEDGTIKEMKDVHGIEVTGGSLPATIWRRFMSQALKGVPARSFPKPELEGVVVNYGGPDPSSATLAQANPSPSPGSDTRESDSEQPASGEEGNGEDVIGRPGTDDDPAPPNAGQARDNDDDQDEERPTPAATGTGFDDCFPFCN